MYGIYLTAEAPLGDLARLAGLLLRRPYPNLVFHLSMTADDAQIEFLNRFAHDLHAVTDRHTAFLPLIDTFETTASEDRRKFLGPGEAIFLSDLATRFNEHGRRWAFNSSLASRAADAFEVPRAELPCWVFVDVSRGSEIQVFPAPATEAEFAVFRRACEAYGTMVRETRLGDLLTRLEGESERARRLHAEILDSAARCRALERDPDIERRREARERWSEFVRTEVLSLRRLPEPEEAELLSDRVLALARDIGEPWGVTLQDPRPAWPDGRRHVKNLPPQLEKQLHGVFAPVVEFDRLVALRARYSGADAEQAELWSKALEELALFPPLADVYADQLGRQLRDTRRYTRRQRIASAADDARRLIDTFNNLNGPG